MMTENRLRRLLNEGKPSVSTRIWSTWPLYTECVARPVIMTTWNS